jgi:hypothetical protein
LDAVARLEAFLRLAVLGGFAGVQFLDEGFVDPGGLGAEGDHAADAAGGAQRPPAFVGGVGAELDEQVAGKEGFFSDDQPALLELFGEKEG